jgi:hypothetical protein
MSAIVAFSAFNKLGLNDAYGSIARIPRSENRTSAMIYFGSVVLDD